MLFNSFPFLLGFLPITLVGFFLIARHSRGWAAGWLGIASLVFYGWWSTKYIWLLLFSIVFNYGIGSALARNHRVALLIAGVTGDLALLGYFKYCDFFLTTVGLTPLHIVLPLGISFFTFTQIAFLVDVFKKKATEYSFVHYLLFVTYFPHLIAGPILHHGEMMPQFARRVTYQLHWDNIRIGFTYFTIGLAKKVLLADSLAEYATPIFNSARDGTEVGFFASWIGAIAYSLQLYFDFSGYSDMAVGLSKMFGIDLPFNFNSPYKAHNIVEFWRRWHMTLSRFLRDYLYIPLGGNRHGPARRHFNLIVTMLLGGLWHGANWTFVFWGGIHGIFLVINHIWQRYTPLTSHRLALTLNGVLTFICVTIAWVFFRAETFPAAISMLKGMSGLNGISMPISFAHMAPLFGYLPFEFEFNGVTPGIEISPGPLLAWFGLSFSILWLFPNSQEIVARGIKHAGLLGAAYGFLFALTVLSFNRVSEFLYFQF